MNKKFIFVAVTLSIVVCFFAYNKKREAASLGPIQRAWGFNFEENRNPATIVLDSTLLLELIGFREYSAVSRGKIYVPETTVHSLENLSALYQKNNNFKRVSYLNSFIEKLKKRIIGVSYEPYYPSDGWREIEKLIQQKKFKEAEEKSLTQVFFTAKIGHYYIAEGNKKDGLRLLSIALANLDTAKRTKNEILGVVIDGYIKSGDIKRALAIYDQNQSEDLMGRIRTIGLVESCVNQAEYDCAFYFLEPNQDFGLEYRLQLIAQGFLDQNVNKMKEEHQKIIRNIVLRHKKKIKSSDQFYQGLIRDIENNSIPKINK